MKTTPSTRRVAPLAVALCAGALLHGALSDGDAAAQTRDEQAVLGPGAYVFQTRITQASCGDVDRTGYVNTYHASVEGIPGAGDMVMRVIDSSYWPRWTLGVRADGQVTADATSERVRGANHFEVRRSGSRYTGTGTRRYRSGSRTCSVTYDALLRRIDL